jgi:hypothetical protein
LRKSAGRAFAENPASGILQEDLSSLTARHA